MILMKTILFMLLLSTTICRKPDKVYCGNEECSVPISKAKTLINYNSADPDLISFKGNADALVFMKSAGTNQDLWFATIDGKSGFVNTKFLREKKILEKNPSHIVMLPIQEQTSVQPEKVQQAHEVLEGTTIYTTEATAFTVQDVSQSHTENEQTNVIDTPSLQIINPQIVEQVMESNVSSDHVSLHLTPNADLFKNTANMSPESDTLKTGKEEEPSESVVTSDNMQAVENTNEKPIVKNVNEVVVDEDSITLNLPNQDIPQLKIREKSKQNLENPSDFNENSAVSELKAQVSGDDSAEIMVSQLITEIIENPAEVNKNIESPTDVSETQEKFEQSSIINNEEILSDFNQNSVVSESKNSKTDGNLAQTLFNKHTPQHLENHIQIKQNEESHTHISSVESNDEKPSLPQNQNIFASSTGSISDQSASENIDFVNVNVNEQSNDIFEKNDSTVEQIVNGGISKEINPVPNPDVASSLTNNGETFNVETIENQSSDNSNSKAYNNGVIEEKSFNNILIYDSNHNENVNEKLNTISEITENHEKPDGISMNPVVTEIIAEKPSNQINTANPSEVSTEIPGNVPNIDKEEAEPTTSSESVVEKTEPSSIIGNLYSTVSDMWTTTPLPPFIDEMPTTPETHFSLNDDLNKQTQPESAIDKESFSLYDYVLSAYDMVFHSNEKTKSLFDSNDECLISEYCEDGNRDQNNRLTVFMLTTSVSVLLFSLGYYYIDKKKQDGRLVGMINSLQRDLLCSTKECEILKEELTATKTKLAGIEDDSFGIDDMVQSLKEEIEEWKMQNTRLRSSLDDNEKLLRVSENTAGELQNTLSEVENTLSELLTERAHFEEQITELNGKIQAFEEELISISRERDSFQLKYVSAESALDEANKQIKNFEEMNAKLLEAKNTIELQKHEINALKDCIKELKKGGSSNTDVTSIIDHTELKAKLTKAIEEKSALEEKYDVEHKERTRLQEELKFTQQSLHATSQQATEAVTRLEVLGKYFQERESNLMKELNAKEALWLSKQGESASTVEKIEALQQEVQRYKEKCDSLTLELAELESSKRTAIAELEARAHTAWLEARTARRDAAADRDAAATLRRKLASMSAQPEGAPSPQQRIASPLDNTGPDGLGMGVGVIPPPLPPMAFLPPLLPPLPRPPPLGRLPSPHPPRYSDRRYSAESRYSPESRYSAEPARYSPDSRYSPRRYSPDSRYSPRRYSPASRRSPNRYGDGRGSRQRNGPALDTETEYASDSPARSPPPRRRHTRYSQSGPSSGSGCSSESEK